MSPFMQLMLEAVQHFGISETSWPTKKELETPRAEATGWDASLGGQARHLATFCRPLAAMSGGNKQDGGRNP